MPIRQSHGFIFIQYDVELFVFMMKAREKFPLHVSWLYIGDVSALVSITDKNHFIFYFALKQLSLLIAEVIKKLYKNIELV